MYRNGMSESSFNCFYHIECEVLVMESFDQTMQFRFPDEKVEPEVRAVLNRVFRSLKEKNYSPINQIVGYLLSGDPAYIPRHNDARRAIVSLERDEIIEELVKSYLKHCHDED